MAGQTIPRFALRFLKLARRARRSGALALRLASLGRHSAAWTSPKDVTPRRAVLAEAARHGIVNVKVKPSAIEGLGLFAVKPCGSGQRIRQINVVREVTADRPLRPELGERWDHCDYPDGRVVLIGSPDCYLNHSCDPNAYVLYEGERCFIVARRNIAGGEEITCDYNINVTGGDAWECRCGAARCRGSTTGDFFKLPEAIQREYRPFLADWFVRSYGDRLRDLED